MLKDRQSKILKIIVECFVKTGKKISSAAILEHGKLDCSSATIRQEMSILEQLGYLEQPHTSGGRTPTTFGIQYYVDNLLEKKEITLNEKLDNLFKERNKNIDHILSEATKIISEVTNLAAVVISPGDSAEVVEKIQLNQLSETSYVFIIITNKGNVQNKVFNLSGDKEFKELSLLIKILDERLSGTLLSDLQNKLIALEPIIQVNIKNLEKIFQSFVVEMIALTKSSSYTAGEFNLLKYEELDQSKISKLIGMIQNHSTFEQFVKEQEKEIFIGDEGTSVFKHEYKTKGTKGHIALIGPTRMEYDKINALLDKIVEKIEGLYK